MTDIRRGTRIALIAAVLLALAFSAALPAHAAERKIHTYYTGVDLIGTGFTGYEVRYKVVSYYLGKYVRYSRKREIGEIRNNSSHPATKTMSLSKATTRTFSISVSTVIPKKVLQNDINATIGGSLSFNNTISISASATVPAKSERSVYLQYKFSDNKYRYVIQKQTRKMFGKWKNKGSIYKRYNTSTTKVPVLVV